ncbi:hypothetical protein [Limimaricola pyoseonensis]|uniref:Cytochrome C oxidase assembly protein n=1 Tax=Limimaricola pyoseonensis TaxID=521013 RepID=A0A1G7DCH8_9RHOB|nr:hypothetical protein [Limimaricola pyoseonensis]SDE49251.1 hypothetical protein SAMN04488567_1878 [Limimaricola pyoseonensis]
MTMQVEHELHHRRKGRNFGVGLLLVAFVGLIFGLTVVKTLNLGDIVDLERADRAFQPAETGTGADQ